MEPLKTRLQEDLVWRGALTDERAASLFADAPADGPGLVRFLTEEGLLPSDDVLQALCEITGIRPAPAKVLADPSPPACDYELFVRAGGLPVADKGGQVCVVFMDPEAAARAAAELPAHVPLLATPEAWQETLRALAQRGNDLDDDNVFKTYALDLDDASQRTQHLPLSEVSPAATGSDAPEDDLLFVDAGDIESVTGASGSGEFEIPPTVESRPDGPVVSHAPRPGTAKQMSTAVKAIDDDSGEQAPGFADEGDGFGPTMAELQALPLGAMPPAKTRRGADGDKDWAPFDRSTAQDVSPFRPATDDDPDADRNPATEAASDVDRAAVAATALDLDIKDLARRAAADEIERSRRSAPPTPPSDRAPPTRRAEPSVGPHDTRRDVKRSDLNAARVASVVSEVKRRADADRAFEPEKTIVTELAHISQFPGLRTDEGGPPTSESEGNLFSDDAMSDSGEAAAEGDLPSPDEVASFNEATVVMPTAASLADPDDEAAAPLFSDEDIGGAPTHAISALSDNDLADAPTGAVTFDPGSGFADEGEKTVATPLSQLSGVEDGMDLHVDGTDGLRSSEADPITMGPVTVPDVNQHQDPLAPPMPPPQNAVLLVAPGAEALAQAQGFGSGESESARLTHEERLRRLPRYDVGKVIGRGGMATVYLARDRESGATVALKILESHLAEDEVFVQRFHREVGATKALDHDNIIHVFDAGNVSDIYFMATEYVGGGTLLQLLRHTGGWTAPLLVPAMIDVLAGLGYAHRQGLIHRDLKPANLMLTDEGRVKIMDFGIAKSSDDATITQTGTLFGTPAYMSPEQALGRDLDARSDLFSIGIVFYQLATGKNPFQFENPSTSLFKISKGDYPPLFGVTPWMPAAVEQVVEKLLTVDPNKRYQTADEAIADLVPIQTLLDQQHPEALRRALADPAGYTAELRTAQADRELAFARAALGGSTPRPAEGAFRLFVANRLDPKNRDAKNELKDVSKRTGYRFKSPNEPRILEVLDKINDEGPTAGLTRRAAELHSAQRDLFGFAKYLKMYLRFQPGDRHMQLRLAQVVGDDPLVPFTELPPPPGDAAPAVDEVVPGLHTAGAYNNEATPPVATRSIDIAPPPLDPMLASSGSSPAPAASDASSAHQRRAELPPPADSLEAATRLLQDFWEEVVRSFTGDAGVEGLKAWYRDRFGAEERGEMKQKAQQLAQKGRAALDAQKRKLLDESEREKMQHAAQGFWQTHRRLILAAGGVLLLLMAMSWGCSAACSYVIGNGALAKPPTMGGNSGQLDSDK